MVPIQKRLVVFRKRLQLLDMMLMEVVMMVMVVND